jgi:chorismate dehydratase
VRDLEYYPELIPATEGFEQKIKGDTAALIIGDRTIGLHDKYPYVYDLAEAWTAWTGLPFVFAAWIAVRPLPDDVLRQFNSALEAGIRYIPELVKILPICLSLTSNITTGITSVMNWMTQSGRA